MVLWLALALGFVKARGPDLVLDGRPFHFVGANLRVMHGETGRAHYEDIIAGAARDGLTVGRVWALGEGDPDAPPWRQKYDLFRAGPDGWIEDAYVQLDRVLASARKHGLRLIIVLSNHWKDYGGAPQYLRWLGLLDETFGAQDRFYSDPGARRAFAAHVERLLARKNSIDGTPYVDDPAILSWELMNESQVMTPEGMAARRKWIAWAAALIKARDKNHLVAPGLLGYRFSDQREDWIAAHQLPGVDYADAHIYPLQRARIRKPADLDAVIDDYAQLARYVIGKPLVIGEYGFPTREKSWRDVPVTRWFEHLLARVRLDGAAGALAWIYQSKDDFTDQYPIFVEDDASALVRRTLAHAAAALAHAATRPQNPLLSASRGARPILDLHVDLAGTSKPLADWKDDALPLEPDAYAHARWEDGGTWAEGALVHAYGGRTGYFEYRFARPRDATGAPAALELKVRLSSEYPGELSPVNGTSHVVVTLDGHDVAELDAFPDDGRGRWYTVHITDTAELARGGVHAIRLEVRPGPHAHGLCVYGRAGKQGGVADAGPGVIRWLSRS